MRTLKFIGKNRNEFTIALRKNVNDYFKEKGISTKGNISMVFKSIILISLYTVPFVLMLTLPLYSWTIFPLSFIMGVGMAGIGMGVMHDAIHGSFSNKKWINNLFGSTCYIIGGNPFTWRVQHNVLHHTYTNIDGFDEDIEPKGSLRLSKHTPLKKIHRFQHIYAFFLYCFMSLSRTFRDIPQLIKYCRAGFDKQQGSTLRTEMIKLILSKTIYLGIIIGFPFIFSSYSWWMIALGFLIMHATAGFFMGTVFQMAHVVEEVEQPLPDEKDIVANEWAIHELETTANFGRNSRLFAWIIGGLNFQVEHHLFPNICHVHYKAISPIVERTVKEYGLRYNENRTFLTALGSHVRMLKALGK
jgi:linoleoyl-CoA desaturase